MTLPTAADDSLSQPGGYFRDRRPIRGELFGPERLTARARAIAAASTKVEYPSGHQLLDMAAAAAKSLRASHRALAASAAHRPPTGAAEWIYDNFHIVEEALREIETDLPPGYYARLPKLAGGALRGLPRAYWLAVELLAHSDSALDEVTLTRYVRAFQDVTPLTIGELWAVPIMLRLGLLENLARLGEGIGSSDNDLARAIDQVTVSNAVTSLRLMSSIDWPVFYEATSVVHARLCSDPAGVYAKQDFATRDRYRQRVELLARDSGTDELAVCDALLGRAGERAAGPGAPPADVPPESHVGHYLFGDGRSTFARELGYAPTWSEGWLDFVRARPRGFYFGGIGLLAAAMLAVVSIPIVGQPLWWLAALLALPVAVEMAVATVNTLVTRLVPPRILPKLDFAKGIPKDCATFVVIPTLLTSAENTAGLVERLEIHSLSNPDPNLYFALLTDWTDAPTETRPADAAQVETAAAAIRELNRRHATGRAPKFFLFHRRRLWNPVQNCWMGWERKRGKLAEFNRLLLGASDTTYGFVSCDPRDLPTVRFVITLDSDTQLPRETAPRLVGTLAHPLNRPRYEPGRRRVTAGYSILQPRVSVSMPAARRSRFSKTLSGSAGIDPYTTATSDVYQDLFGLGTFTGKGIYDLHAFEAATGAAFPENHILSHDLIEGNFSRCGLVSDIEFVDDLPSRYNAFAKREHRWVRGDWQLLPWLGRLAPVPPRGAHGPVGGSGREREWRPNVLPLVERWKVLDNLRRSLTPPALVLLLVLGWTVLPGSPWIWTLIALAVVLFPFVVGVPGVLRAAMRPSFWMSASNDTAAGAIATVGQATMQASFLVHQSYLMLDAVARTVWRLHVSGKKLLEWETAAATERRLGNSLADFCRFMAVSPVAAAVVGAVVAVVRPSALPAALPLLLLWFTAPALAYWVSKPIEDVERPLSDNERLAVRRVARKTWAFFETFVTPDDHMLPPDNFQEYPRGVLARRTSPTNVGLCLLANLAARDFGYIGARRLLDRTAQTLAALDKLERHHGHFLNWYRTDTLAALEPKYVSTVDSGNLLGCLMTLRQGLAETLRSPLAGPDWRDGLGDTLRLAEEALSQMPAAAVSTALRGQLADIGAILTAEPTNDWIERLVAAASVIDVDGLPEDGELGRWVDALVAQVRELRGEAALGATSVGAVAEFASTAARLEALATGFIDEMDFRILYNDSRHLFTIGFNLTDGRYNPEHYDLLASEACLTSFLTVARGEAHRRHWFQIGRPVTRAGDSIALVSWGGTMFEYLLPRVFFRTYPQTILHLTRENVVAAHIAHGRKRGVPWGISESGYNLADAEQNYQYMSFGVPGLGLKRGLDKDLVVSPYSTQLAAMVRPREAVANFAALAAAGGEGPFGFYEAIDYTPSRLPAGVKNVVVRSYMAHHQGMGFLALANCLFHEPFPRRFHADPSVKATELLLQERVPWDVPIQDVREKGDGGPKGTPPAEAKPAVRRIAAADARRPRAHLLSNGTYTVVVTTAGTGWSSFRGRDVTRRGKDGGTFLYVRDLTTAETWSAGSRPLRKTADESEAAFAIDKATLRRRDGTIETTFEVAVSPEMPAEIRRLTLTNHDARPHDIELTSFSELAGPVDHAGNLPNSGAVVAQRDAETWVMHAVASDVAFDGEAEYETDATTFLGGHAPDRPAALVGRPRLIGREGKPSVPALALRRRLRLPAGSSVGVSFLTAVTPTRERASDLADAFNHPNAVARTFELAWAYARAELRRLDISSSQFHLFQRLASMVLYRPDGEPLANRARFVAVLDEPGSDELVAQLASMYAFWRKRGLDVELCFVADDTQRVTKLVREGPARELLNQTPGIRAVGTTDAERTAIETDARVVLRASSGGLDALLQRLDDADDSADTAT